MNGKNKIVSLYESMISPFTSYHIAKLGQSYKKVCNRVVEKFMPPNLPEFPFPFTWKFVRVFSTLFLRCIFPLIMSIILNQ